MVKNYFYLLKEEFHHYSWEKLLKDLLAGLTVAAVALPLAIAFGVSSGVDAAAGLITAIVAGVVISAFSGGFYQISGPTGAMAAILMSISATEGIRGVLLATFLAGLLLLIAGILKLGMLTSFIPAPVITGFTSGIAIIIALGQVDNLFATTSKGTNVLEKLQSYQTLGFKADYLTLILGLGVILFMIFYPKKLANILPSSLMVIILATLIVAIFKFPVKTVGTIPTTLISPNRLGISDLSLANFQPVLAPAVSIALLGMVESLLCGASAGRMTGKPLASNQELVAQGIGNLLLPFFGGIPATAAIARTSVAIKAGGQTRLTGIFHAVVLFLSMMVLAPVMSMIPMTALAGVLIVTAWRMNEWETIQEFFAKKYWMSLTMFFVTMISTVVFDLSLAIVIGILCGIVFFLIKSAAITISLEEIDWQRMDLKESELLQNWTVVYISGPLFFMSAEKLKQALNQVEAHDGVIFSMRGVTHIDVTALGIFEEFQEKAHQRQQQLIYTSLQPNVEHYMKHLWEETSSERHHTVAHALTKLYETND